MKQHLGLSVPEELEILYRDQYMVAINKPAGLLVHRSRIAKDASEFAVQKLRDQIGQPVHLIHRLDRPTSGVLLFALDSDTAKILSEQFQNRLVSKRYELIVRGKPPLSGMIDDPLLEKLDRKTDGLADAGKASQTAVTHFETIQTWQVPVANAKYPTSFYSLVKANPITGRRHQIRRHFNHMGNPIVGDTSHGDRRHNRLFQKHFGIGRLMLAARKLNVKHPINENSIEILAPRPDEFQKAISKFQEFFVD